VKPDLENRLAEGSIPALFQTSVRRITSTCVRVAGPDGETELPAEGVLLLTGYHPDWTLLRRAGVMIDAAGPVARYDSETLETDVPNLFLAGGVVSADGCAGVHRERQDARGTHRPRHPGAPETACPTQLTRASWTGAHFGCGCAGMEPAGLCLCAPERPSPTDVSSGASVSARGRADGFPTTLSSRAIR